MWNCMSPIRTLLNMSNLINWSTHPAQLSSTIPRIHLAGSPEKAANGWSNGAGSVSLGIASTPAFNSCISLRVIGQGCGWSSTITLSPSDMGVRVVLSGWQVLSCWQGPTGVVCTGGGEMTWGVFCSEFQLKKLKISFSFFCGGCVLITLFSLHVLESQCTFRLLIPLVPTWTSVSQSGQWSLLSAMNWLLLLQLASNLISVNVLCW